jgi:hypothetical protein
MLPPHLAGLSRCNFTANSERSPTLRLDSVMMLVDICAEQEVKNVLIFGSVGQYLGGGGCISFSVHLLIDLPRCLAFSGFYVTSDDKVTIAHMCRWLSLVIDIKPSTLHSEVELSFDEITSAPKCTIWSVRPCVLKSDVASPFAYHLEPGSLSFNSQSTEMVEPGCYIVSGRALSLL